MSAEVELGILEITLTENTHEDMCVGSWLDCPRVALWDVVNECGCTWAVCQYHREVIEHNTVFMKSTMYTCSNCTCVRPDWVFVPHRRSS